MYSISADFNDCKLLNGALGIHAAAYSLQDNNARNTQIALLYAKRLGVTKNMFFNIGLQSQFSRRDIPNNAVFSPPVASDLVSDNEKYPTGPHNQDNLDFGTGAVFRFNNRKADSLHWLMGTIGGAIQHIHLSDNFYVSNSDYKTPIKSTLHADVSIKPFHNCKFIVQLSILHSFQNKIQIGNNECFQKYNSADLHVLFPIENWYLSSIYCGIGGNYSNTSGHFDRNQDILYMFDSYRACFIAVGTTKTYKAKSRIMKSADIYYSLKRVTNDILNNAFLIHEITASFAVPYISIPARPIMPNFFMRMIKYPADRYKNLDKVGR